jgi:predicted transcriptional regulator
MKVVERMTTEISTVSPETKAAFAFLKMVQFGFRHLPVIDSDDKVWGIVSYGDLREALLVMDQQKKLLGIITESDLLSTLVEFMDLLSDSNEVCLNLPGDDFMLRKALSEIKADGSKECSFRVQTRNVEILRNRFSKKGYNVIGLA